MLECEDSFLMLFNMVLPLFLLFAPYVLSSPLTSSTNSTLEDAPSNSFPFNTPFERRINTGIRHLKQTYPGVGNYLFWASPVQLPWAYEETEFQKFELAFQNLRNQKEAVQQTKSTNVNLWADPFEEDWATSTPYRTWELSEYKTPLKSVLKILNDELEIPGPWIEVRLMKW